MFIFYFSNRKMISYFNTVCLLFSSERKKERKTVRILKIFSQGDERLQPKETPGKKVQEEM